MMKVELLNTRKSTVRVELLDTRKSTVGVERLNTEIFENAGNVGPSEGMNGMGCFIPKTDPAHDKSLLPSPAWKGTQKMRQP